MKIKKGDKVKILAGKDKGKTGKVLQVFTARKRASVEGRNLLIKHMRPKKQGEKGQRIEFPAPLAVSNLMFICPKCNRPARIGYKYIEVRRQGNIIERQNTEKGIESGKRKKKIRICARCKQVVD